MMRSIGNKVIVKFFLVFLFVHYWSCTYACGIWYERNIFIKLQLHFFICFGFSSYSSFPLNYLHVTAWITFCFYLFFHIELSWIELNWMIELNYWWQRNEITHHFIHVSYIFVIIIYRLLGIGSVCVVSQDNNHEFIKFSLANNNQLHLISNMLLLSIFPASLWKRKCEIFVHLSLRIWNVYLNIFGGTLKKCSYLTIFKDILKLGSR